MIRMEKQDLLKKLDCDYYDLKHILDALNEHMTCEDKRSDKIDKDRLFEYKQACIRLRNGLGEALGALDLRIRILRGEGGDDIFDRFNHLPKKPKDVNGNEITIGIEAYR